MLEKQVKSINVSHQRVETDSFKDVLEKVKGKGVELPFEDIKEIQKQRQAVKDKYFGTEKWMKAPNGQESKLTEGQWLAVRTPYFKAWFGDWENDRKHASKMLDQDTCEPKVFYHGSGRAIEEFVSLGERKRDMYSNFGIYFSPNHEASAHFADLKVSRIKDGAPSIYPVFLRIINPKTLDNTRHVDKEKRDQIIANGYDGLIEQEGWEGLPEARYFKDQIVVVFYGNQVKSAIGNIGTFSKDSNDISL